MIGKGRGYGDLLEHTTLMAAGKGVQVRVLDLEALIQVKGETATEKDKAVLLLLRRTLAEKSRE